MNVLKGKTIVIGVTGGIAGYKLVDLIALLREQGANGHVVMTRGATSLFDKKIFEKASGKKVLTDVFEKDVPFTNYTKKKQKIPHIELADSADVILVAPATANILAKAAGGIADDLLTTMLLATHALVLFAPSMNVKMLSHPATQENLKKLQAFGHKIIWPDYGDLACGYKGEGRLPTTQRLLENITAVLQRKKILVGKKVLVTAGATIEAIDPVRVITNRSSGKMGRAIAETAYHLGATVVLLHGKQAVRSRYLFDQITFTSGEDLAEKMKKYSEKADVIIHNAAVGDFSIKKQFKKKIDSGKTFHVTFTPSPKIVDQIKLWNPNAMLIAFKAVYNVLEKDLIKKAKELLSRSHADFVVVNDVGKKGVGFEADTNAVTIFDKKGKVVAIPLMSKENVAEKMWEVIL